MRVAVTIKKYSVNKPPYIQIRLFTAKENEAMKQVAYVKYTLNEFNEMSQILGDFMLVIIVSLGKTLWFVLYVGQLKHCWWFKTIFCHWSEHLELEYLRKSQTKHKNWIKIDIKHYPIINRFSRICYRNYSENLFNYSFHQKLSKICLIWTPL